MEVENEGGLVLNYGAALFSPGDRLSGYTAGEPGATSGAAGLDSGEPAAAVVEIVDVGEDFARARTVAGAPLGRGASLRRLTAGEQAPRERPRSGPAW